MLPANFILQDMSDSCTCIRADPARVEFQGLGPAGCFTDKVNALVCIHGRQRHYCGMPAVLSNIDQAFAARKAHDLAYHSLSIFKYHKEIWNCISGSRAWNPGTVEMNVCAREN